MKRKILLFLASTASYILVWWALVLLFSWYFLINLDWVDGLLFSTVFSPLLVIPARFLALEFFRLIGDDDGNYYDPGGEHNFWSMFASPSKAFNFYWEQGVAFFALVICLAFFLASAAIGALYFLFSWILQVAVWLARLVKQPPVWWLLLFSIPYVLLYIATLFHFWPQLLEPNKFWFHLLFISVFFMGALSFREIKFLICSFLNYAYQRPAFFSLFETPRKAILFWLINLLLGPICLIGVIITNLVIGITILKEFFKKPATQELSKG